MHSFLAGKCVEIAKVRKTVLLRCHFEKLKLKDILCLHMTERRYGQMQHDSHKVEHCSFVLVGVSLRKGLVQ